MRYRTAFLSDTVDRAIQTLTTPAERFLVLRKIRAGREQKRDSLSSLTPIIIGYPLKCSLQSPYVKETTVNAV